MIFIVMGTTGEYSGCNEWPVCAYVEKALADKHADEAMQWAHKNAPGSDYGKREAARGLSPWDPNFQADYTGTDYYVMTVPVRAALPVVVG